MKILGYKDSTRELSIIYSDGDYDRRIGDIIWYNKNTYMIVEIHTFDTGCTNFIISDYHRRDNK